VYRVAQEALNNALRHSGADDVAVSLMARRGRVILEVTDDGKGFGTQTPPGGLGLPSMRERAASVGGSLTIRSAPGEGTMVRLSVPVGQP
jgi:signal transduction histidine kinase